MAGIYIHVPFCKKKCIYCDFYSVGTLSKISDYPYLIEKELELRKDFIGTVPIDTIYFGGGTPSLLPPIMISRIINSISNHFTISINPEVTIEVNPDDISKESLTDYLNSGVNRISIGIQSFIDKDLTFLGRRHDSNTAIKSIENALTVGFKNISIDLIYGLPESNLTDWEFNLAKAFSFDIQHISCYHLTYEEGTVLTRRLKDSKIISVDESISVQQFERLQDLSSKNGFIHYEVSNFAKEGFYSKHNSSYWKGVHYLGLGPSAHSYNGSHREWNPNSYSKWEDGINQGNPVTQSEVTDQQAKVNETLITRLRTIWGLNLLELRRNFGEEIVDQIIISAEPYIKAKKLILNGDFLQIPPEHFFTSDGIIEDLLIIDNPSLTGS